MTAVAEARVPTGNVVRLSAGRLLRLELRRSAMLWMVPLALILFWFDTYRGSMMSLSLWNARVMYLEEGRALVDFAPFVAGAAAWTASRDGRRGTDDQVSATSLPRWAARLAAWAATTCWALVAYLAGVGLIYGITASQGAWGSPPWWPVVVGAVGVAAFSAVGFVAGALFPSRFTAPLTGIVALFVLVLGQYKITGSATYGLISPTNNQDLPSPDVGVFFPFRSGVPITQTLFLAGLGLAALSVLGLSVIFSARLMRGAAVAVCVIGLAAAGTAIGLAGTTRITGNGPVIPSLDGSAGSQPIPYKPVCSSSAIPVCLHPAYKAELPAISAALAPVLSEFTGLTGAPARITQVPAQAPNVGGISGNPPVFNVSLGAINATSSAQLANFVRQQAVITIVNNVIGNTSPAQQAVSAGLLKAYGVSLSTAPPSGSGRSRSGSGPGSSGQGSSRGSGGPQPGTPVYAAAQRFAALSATARRAWLVSHLSALRAGRITLEQVP